MDVTVKKNENYIAVGGDFSSIFDKDDYLSMLNTQDEVACILRAHLILEETLDIFANKVTNCTDIFGGTFIPFKTKLVIAKNLGLDDSIYVVLDKINDIRNKFSHRKKYKFDKQGIEALAKKVDSIKVGKKINKCEVFEIYIQGKDQNGEGNNISYKFENADNKIQFLIVFINFMLKVTWWLQNEFNKRNINYTIISTS